MINNPLLQQAARKLHIAVHDYHSEDSLCGQQLTGVTQKRIWNIPSSVTKDALRVLLLFHGM